MYEKGIGRTVDFWYGKCSDGGARRGGGLARRRQRRLSPDLGGRRDRRVPLDGEDCPWGGDCDGWCISGGVCPNGNVCPNGGVCDGTGWARRHR